jgi:hypothetical protein
MMKTIRLRTIEGRRMRDPAHPKRAVIETGKTFDVSVNDVHWTRRLLDGDVEEVLRKVRVVKGRVVKLPPEKEGGEPRELKEGAVAEVSALDPYWALAFERGDAELVPDEEPKPQSAPVNAPLAPLAVNAAAKAEKE